MFAALVLATAAVVASPAHAAEEATVLRAAVVVVDYTDENAQVDDAMRASIANRIFGASGSVRSFYLEASDRTVAIEPMAGQPQVLGPWTIPIAASCENVHTNLHQHAIQALASHGIAPSQYQRLSIVFPNHKLRCDNDYARGQMPGSVTWVPDTFLDGDATMFTHELGHNFGFDHVETLTCAAGTLTNCAPSGFSGDATVMGGGGYDSALNAAELMHKGWLLADAVTQVGTGTGAFTLKPLHAAASVTGARVLVIDTGVAGKQLYVSYRKNGTTIDTRTGEGVQLIQVTNGALHDGDLVDTRPTNWGAVDADLAVGRSVRLPSGRTVKTVGSSAGEAIVRVG